MRVYLLRGVFVCLFSVLLFIFLSCSDEFENALEPDTIPPKVRLDYPLPGDTVSSQTPLVVKASDESGITIIRFFVDGYLVAEDCCEPYDQIWYSGYWNDNTYYDLTVEAVDGNGNVTLSDATNVLVAEDSHFTVELVSPADEAILDVGLYHAWTWNPVPGAQGYIIRMKTEDVLWLGCDVYELDICYIYVDRTDHHIFMADRIYTPIRWCVQAYWDTNHTTGWSEEWHFISDYF